MKPSQFDPTSQAFYRNPWPTFARMRAQGDLVQSRLPLVGEVWLATSYEAVQALLHDQQQFALQPQRTGKARSAGLKWWMPRVLRVLAKNMLTSDEPDHRRLRNLVEQAFVRQSVSEMRGRIESLADELLDGLARRSQESSAGVDFVEHFARPFPLAVICELLGLPAADRPRFAAWANQLTQITSLWSFFPALGAIRQLVKYLQQQFVECRRHPRPGLISALVEAEQDGQRLSDDELLSMVFLLLLAGYETTAHLLSGGVLTLLEQPVQLQILQNDWSLAKSTVDEVLRYCSPVQMSKPRYALANTEFFGQPLRRGDVVMALVASANCDPVQFDRAEEFDVCRVPNQHLTFGSGIHVCLGLKLAQAEGEVAWEKLFSRFPHLELAVPPGELLWRERVGMRALTSLPLSLEPNSVGRR